MPDPDSQHDTRKLGQGMIAVAFAIGIALLTWMFSGLEDDARNPNRDAEYRSTSNGGVAIDLERNRAGHYVMSGSINSVPTDFILDTGATDVVIPESLAREAGLEPGYAGQAMTANGAVTVYLTTIDSLQLGPIRLHDVRASINPAMHDSMVLLGMSALRQVEFTQRNDRLTLRHIGR